MALPPAGFPIGVLDGHRRSRHAFIVLIALGVISGGTISSQNNTDCAAAYRSYLEELKHKDIMPQRRAALQRWSLRIYDACETGDLEDTKELFERLDRRNY